MNYFLGVEGGGSKTNVLLADQDSTQIATATTGPSNYHVVGITGAVVNIIDGIYQCLEKARINPSKIRGIGMGIAGINTDTDKKNLDEAISPKLEMRGLPKAEIVNDTVISLLASATLPNAVLLICGTGSNCYGINDASEEVWVGGIESVLSDDGSGYMMGLKALRSAAQSMDGRIQHTILEDLILKELNVVSMREASLIVQSSSFTKTNIAALAMLVFEAEKEGDSAAKKIIRESIDEAYTMVITAIRRLKIQEKEFNFILTGSISHNEVFNKPLITLLKNDYPGLRLPEKEQHPLWGAIKIAHSTQCFPSR
jgi:N-acetylglucosamine kinase-like BadF-type ATPase